MARGFPYDVFLSYSPKDKAIVLPLAERLRSDGLRVWLADREIKPRARKAGRLSKIEAGLEQSRVLVLGMSANAFGSDWPALEAGTFRFRDPLNKERRFIPLQLDKAPIKDSLAQFSCIPWLGEGREEDYAKLVDACRPPQRQPTAEQEAARARFEARVFSLGHTASVRSVVFSPDGTRALSGSDDNTVRVWDVDTGQCQRVLEGHSSAVYSVAFSPDGRLALTGSEDNTARLWDVDTGRCRRVLEGHSDAVMSVGFSLDGRLALSGSHDKTARIWDVDTGQCRRVLEGHSDAVMSVGFSPDGRHALTGSLDKTARLWDLENGQCRRALEGHSESVLSVAFSPDGRLALSGSRDNTARLWDLETGQCRRALEGHSEPVWSVAFSPDGRLALTGSHDNTARLWDLENGLCRRALEGHSNSVLSVAFSPDGRLALSGSDDNTARLWDLENGQCRRALEGHSEPVWSVAFSPDGQLALTGSADNTARFWDLENGQCRRVLEGHSNFVWSVAFSPDGQLALSGSQDNTARLWDLDTGQCRRVLEGHSHGVLSVAISPDGRLGLSGSDDNTARLWDLEDGQCRRVLERHSASVRSVAFSRDGATAYSGALNGVVRAWTLRDLVHPAATGASDFAAPDQLEYTNAKVLIVGDTSSGKTGLAHRLAMGKWVPSDGSTVGAWSTQWPLRDHAKARGIEKEIWLWDFGGQADQRLVHQLFMDRAALILLLFDADKEDVLPGLREWRVALRRSVRSETPQFLVAGRIDAGFRASRAKLQAFAQENGLRYVETSAKDGDGCPELSQAITEVIPWGSLERRTSPVIFKRIKDEILKLRDDNQVLHTFKELRETLRQRLPAEDRFKDETLTSVIGLLDGPGVLKELDYGTYILLQPEWINAYAQAVIRTLRQDPRELGCLPLRAIAEGQLLFQTVTREGGIAAMKRLPEPDERVVLREMERQLEERGLCLRQGDKLVFPSHCGRDRPAKLEYPSIFVSYVVRGYIDDIYATLVVKLTDSGAVRLNELWRGAADFETLDGSHHMGIKLSRDAEDSGEVSVYFGPGVTPSEQVIFANYIHTHLEKNSGRVQRLRHYVCPGCHTPKGNPHVLMEKLLAKREATVICDRCDKPFPLWDDLERLFASPTVREAVNALNAHDVIRLDSRRKGKLLALEVAARISSADQKCFEIPGTEDEGIDMELEFTDDDGRGTGKRLYLQLKSGNSFLHKRKKDDAEIFTIKEPRWVDYWLKQPMPVMLVIGTFAESDERFRGKDKLEFENVRWMEIRSYLQRESADGTKPVRQIVFTGERLDLSSVRRWRDVVLGCASR
jgi:small GTP-binding protein